MWTNQKPIMAFTIVFAQNILSCLSIFTVVHKSQTTEVGFIAKFVKEFDNVYIIKKCRFRNVSSLNLILMAHKMYIFCSEQNKLGYTATRITSV